MKKFESLEHGEGDSDVLAILEGSRDDRRKWEMGILHGARD